KVVDVVTGPGSPAPDLVLAATVQAWVKKHDAALGESIGYTRSGLDANGAVLHTWYARAIREKQNVDVCILNRKGFRGGVAPGAIRPGCVYGAMPFDDSLLTVKLKGTDLVAALENPEAVYDGAAKKDGKWTVKGKPVDPAGTYSGVTFEYLYFGGDNF